MPVDITGLAIITEYLQQKRQSYKLDCSAEEEFN
jgi:hypothetical protein